MQGANGISVCSTCFSYEEADAGKRENRDNTPQSNTQTASNETPTNGNATPNPIMITIAVFHFGKS
ncbi:hypothetical protein D9M71_186900 [compost metagenome]